jgi:hypothetical protein
MRRKILLLSLVAVCGLAIGCAANVANVLKIEAQYKIFTGEGFIVAYVEPTTHTRADTLYMVTLYKYDTALENKLITWTQEDIAALTPQIIEFPLSEADTITYIPTPWTSHSDEEPAFAKVFSVKVGVAPTPAMTPAAPSAYIDTILGTWRHGLPEERPAHMSQNLYEELKGLPESKTYYLEFFEDDKVQFICEDQIVDGTYTFVSDEEVEISWSVLGGTLAEFFDGYGVYQVVFSEDKMTLWGGLEECATYLRVE